MTPGSHRRTRLPCLNDSVGYHRTETAIQRSMEACLLLLGTSSTGAKRGEMCEVKSVKALPASPDIENLIEIKAYNMRP